MSNADSLPTPDQIAALRATKEELAAQVLAEVRVTCALGTTPDADLFARYVDVARRWSDAVLAHCEAREARAE